MSWRGLTHAVPTALVLLLCGAATAHAAELRLVDEFGSQGSGPGQLAACRGCQADLEVAPSGNLVVSDTGNRRIQVFTPGGTLVRTFGSQGTGPGQFASPTGVAIQDDGTIFVVDSGAGRVEVFSEAGAFLREFQLPNLSHADAAFNRANTRLYLVNSLAGNIQRMSAAGADLGVIGAPGAGNGQLRRPQGIDVGPAGNLYVADRDNNRVQKVRPNGAFIGKRGGLGSAPGQMRTPLDVALGPNSLFVADTGNGRLQEFSRGQNLIAAYDRLAGSPNPTFVPEAVAVAPNTGDIFILDSAGSRIIHARVRVDSPTLGKDVNVSEATGTVLVDVPGGGGFAPIEETRQIPVGSKLDTRKGTVSLKSASNKSGGTQTGKFSQGIFKVQQGKNSDGITDLRLAGGDFDDCRKGSRKVIRRLRGRGPTVGKQRKGGKQAKGGRKKKRYRTRGRNSASTVRGTDWRTTDRCDGTVTKVFKGTVEVRDFVRDKTITLHAGESYLAKARGN